MDIDLHNFRKNYAKYHLNENELSENPFTQFATWFKDAQNSSIQEPNAMMLSTANASGKPSSRIVLLKEVNDEGFIFFSNYLSRKGREIAANPQAALLFFWDVLERQIRIEGEIKKVDEAISENYFNSRPLDSRIGSIISKQSEVIASREVLEEAFEKYKAADNISRPKNWGGYILIPDYFEFWQGRPNRIHDRITFSKKENSWLEQRLAP